ncbi:MAG: hypothetical protein QOH41_940 [Blastocatellia bacterium]|nr:hypothetical protein [Blastocatellia bacterium]
MVIATTGALYSWQSVLQEKRRRLTQLALIRANHLYCVSLNGAA